MRFVSLAPMLLAAAVAFVPTRAPGEPPAQSAPQSKVTAFDGLGKHTRKVATKKPDAQKFFDQGLNFMFAFNHDEAIRGFKRAAELDPDCAMAYWGMALASGVNYNDPRF